jgi:exonuclease III
MRIISFNVNGIRAIKNKSKQGQPLQQQEASILQQLNIDAVDKSILTQLMRVLGFEDDVIFAKSLLAHQIISINAIHQ